MNDNLVNTITLLEELNDIIAKATLEKESLVKSIIDQLGHQHEGSKSYEHGIYKIECKTPMIYSLDKKAYEEGNYFIDDIFNPVRAKVSYDVEKAAFEKAMQIAPDYVREALTKLITKKPGKAGVTIKKVGA
jgi:hypothetical protein